MGDVFDEITSGISDIFGGDTSSIIGDVLAPVTTVAQDLASIPGVASLVGAAAGVPLPSPASLFPSYGSMTPAAMVGGTSYSPLPAYNYGLNGAIDAALPTAAGAGSGSRALTTLPRWATQFPALWQLVMKLRAAAGGSVSAIIERLWSLVKKFGPQAVIAAGVMTAEQLAQLTFFKTSRRARRKYNPANVKALRRSMRRLAGFDRLASRVRGQLACMTPSRARTRSARCRKCRTIPCCC